MNDPRRQLRFQATNTASFRSGCFALAVVVLAAGCHRTFYRHQADYEAYSAIAQKANDERWDLPDFEIAIDPRSRMFDPFNPDYEPMPPDDTVSHQLMNCVDHKRGYPHWYDNGVTPFVENPMWREYLPLDEDGVLTLNRDLSVKLAIIHSPDYQEEFEELFLSALDVTAERFRFDSQLFAGYGSEYFAAGRAAPGATAGGSTSLWNLAARSETSGTAWQIRKAFTSGADLVVGLANSLIWQVSGPDTHTATTILDFTLVQPLLRQAGRDRIMETLTLAERTLLANVRQMERFRRGFQLDIITGSGDQPGANRRGGFFGTSGFAGFTGVGGGGFGRVGGFGGTFGDGIGGAQAGGFLGLLQTQMNIRNLETNITALRSSLAQLEAFRDAGRIDFFQVEQARQDLFTRQSELLTSKTEYQNGLDRFKRQIGLPPQLEVRIEDAALYPFNLIDPAITPLQDEVASIQQSAGRAILSLFPFDELEEQQAADVRWSQEMADQLKRLIEYLNRIEALRARFEGRNLPRADHDIQQLTDVMPQRVNQLQDVQRRLADALASGVVRRELGFDPHRTDVDTSMFDVEVLQQLPDELRENLTKLRERLAQETLTAAKVAEDLNDLIENGGSLPQEMLLEQLVDRVVVAMPLALSEFSTSVLELSLIQARARTETINLQPVEMDSATAITIARSSRRDWMNARANLVDAWRLIEFTADSLESDLDVIVSGDIRNLGDNPTRIRETTGQLRVGVQFDAPITRLLERNIYRESLIDYQQARRRYYRFEDQVSASLRATLRQSRLDLVNFELRRAAVQVAVRQVELARLRLQEPPKPDEVDSRLGATTARDLVDALSNLRNAQDAFLGVWISYEITRRNLDLELGTMELDEDGLWIDPGAIGLQYGYPVSSEELDQLEAPIALPAGCLVFPAVRIEGEPELEAVPPADPLPEPDSQSAAAPRRNRAQTVETTGYQVEPAGLHRSVSNKTAAETSPRRRLRR